MATKRIDTNKAFATVKKANSGITLRSNVTKAGTLNPTVSRIANIAQKSDKQIFSEAQQGALSQGKSQSEAVRIAKSALSSAKARLSESSDKDIFESARSEAKQFGASNEDAFKAGKVALDKAQTLRSFEKPNDSVEMKRFNENLTNMQAFEPVATAQVIQDKPRELINDPNAIVIEGTEPAPSVQSPVSGGVAPDVFILSGKPDAFEVPDESRIKGLFSLEDLPIIGDILKGENSTIAVIVIAIVLVVLMLIWKGGI